MDSIRKEIFIVWEDLGRERTKLKLSNKSKKELKIILEKLKTIKMSFGLLFSPRGNHNLAIELLISTFIDGKKEK